MLMEKAIDSLRFSGGYFVSSKFEEVSTQSCLTVVLSAFNDILLQIARSKPVEHLNMIYASLISEFGSNFQELARILPNVLLLHSCDANTDPAPHQIDSNVNFMSLCFTLQRFMKIMSASAGPGLLFLDGKSATANYIS